jgi:hypothetical protein
MLRGYFVDSISASVASIACYSKLKLGWQGALPLQLKTFEL